MEAVRGVVVTASVIHVALFGHTEDQINALFAAEAISISNTSRVIMHSPFPHFMDKGQLVSLSQSAVPLQPTSIAFYGSSRLPPTRVLALAAFTSFWPADWAYQTREHYYRQAAQQFSCKPSVRISTCYETIHLRLGNLSNRNTGLMNIARFHRHYVPAIRDSTACIALDDHARASHIRRLAPNATLLPDNRAHSWCTMRASRVVTALTFSIFSWTAAISGGATYRQIACDDAKLRQIWGYRCQL